MTCGSAASRLAASGALLSVMEFPEFLISETKSFLPGVTFALAEGTVC